MKRVLLTVIMFMCLVGLVYAVGSITTTGPTKVSSHVYTISYTWTGDASGNVTAAAGPAIDGHVLFVVTDPGTTAPTDNYDLTLVDSDSVDVMGGELANRDTANSEQAMPKIGSSYGKRYVKGTLTLNVSNNTQASANGSVKVYIGTDAPLGFR